MLNLLDKLTEKNHYQNLPNPFGLGCIMYALMQLKTMNSAHLYPHHSVLVDVSRKIVSCLWHIFDTGMATDG
jgi:hypothetical protein